MTTGRINQIAVFVRSRDNETETRRSSITGRDNSRSVHRSLPRTPAIFFPFHSRFNPHRSPGGGDRNGLKATTQFPLANPMLLGRARALARPLVEQTYRSLQRAHRRGLQATDTIESIDTTTSKHSRAGKRKSCRFSPHTAVRAMDRLHLRERRAKTLQRHWHTKTNQSDLELTFPKYSSTPPRFC